MLINLSNHPYSLWSEGQKQAAKLYGNVQDISFPKINAKANEQVIETLTNKYVDKIKKLAVRELVTVHIMGEMTFTVLMVSKLQKLNILCIASTSERNVQEVKAGVKQVNFEFVRFREYPLL